MNLTVIRWLLAHRDVLMKSIEAVSRLRSDMNYLEKWEIVDQIARLVIPMFDGDIQALINEEVSEWELVAMSEDSESMQLMSAGAEMQALGLDWAIVVRVLVPIIVNIIRSMMRDRAA